MESIFAGSALGHAARTVKSVAGGTSHWPILQSVQLKGMPDGIELNATDLETWVAYRIDGLNPAPAAGTTAYVDTGTLASVTAKLKGSASVSLEPGALYIGAVSIPGIDAETVAEYPTRPATGSETPVYTGNGAQFKALVKRLRVTSLDERKTTRLQLCAVNVEFAGIDASAGCTLCTTTGYVLSLETYGAPFTSDATRRALIPTAALAKCGSAAGARDAVSISIAAGAVDAVSNQHAAPYAIVRILNAAGALEYRIRCIDEQFPDFRRIIPGRDAKASFTVDAEQLERLITDARAVANSSTEVVTLEILEAGFASTPGNWLQASSTSDRGSFCDRIRIENLRSDAGIEPISFNAGLLAAVAGFGDGSITLSRNGALQAMRIDFDADRVAVVMPLNLK